jgi:hypothetical protein
MRVVVRWGAWLVITATAACWADFPENRFGKTPDRALPDSPRLPDWGLSDSPIVDHSVLEAAADQPRPTDGPPPDLSPDLLVCVPNSAIKCTTDYVSIVKCSKTGFGTVEVSCTPYKCEDMLRRCNGCNISDPASCDGTNLVTCSLDGLPQKTPCAQGCKAGKCCADIDKDGFTPCDGDCNDSEKQVYPGQKTFFETAIGSSFDYDCNSTNEQQYPDIVNCQNTSGGCSGDGWEFGGPVPKCGDTGKFVACKKQGMSCFPQMPVFKKQACR